MSFSSGVNHVRVRLVGVLRTLAGTSETSISLSRPVTVGEAVRLLLDKAGSNALVEAIFDRRGDPRSSLLILVNDKEISALEGIGTMVFSGDELVLIPVAHGGSLDFDYLALEFADDFFCLGDSELHSV